MNLNLWNSVPEIPVLQDQMNRLFEDAFQRRHGKNEATHGWMPAADVYETDNELILKADLPGIEPKQIEIRVENNMLTIRGERRFEQKVQRENYHQVERMYGS